ncbi:MAG: hypothetical protein ABIQ16_26930 [Polyangiaceae bacterium]
MTETSLPTSLALVNFASTLARRDPDWFRPEAALLGHFGASLRAEDTIIFRLADQAVRVWGAAMLELNDRKCDADALRMLPPITDRQSSAVAVTTILEFDCRMVSHANNCATAAAGDAGSSEFIGSQAAFAAIALANGYHDRRKLDVYESAAALLDELRSEVFPLH